MTALNMLLALVDGLRVYFEASRRDIRAERGKLTFESGKLSEQLSFKYEKSNGIMQHIEFIVASTRLCFCISGTDGGWSYQIKRKPRPARDMTFTHRKKIYVHPDVEGPSLAYCKNLHLDARLDSITMGELLHDETTRAQFTFMPTIVLKICTILVMCKDTFVIKLDTGDHGTINLYGGVVPSAGRLKKNGMKVPTMNILSLKTDAEAANDKYLRQVEELLQKVILDNREHIKIKINTCSQQVLKENVPLEARVMLKHLFLEFWKSYQSFSETTEKEWSKTHVFPEQTKLKDELQRLKVKNSCVANIERDIAADMQAVYVLQNNIKTRLKDELNDV